MTPASSTETLGALTRVEHAARSGFARRTCRLQSRLLSHSARAAHVLPVSRYVVSSSASGLTVEFEDPALELALTAGRKRAPGGGWDSAPLLPYEREAVS